MGNVADLLRDLGTLESCEARVPTAYEQDFGEVPSWCELVLILERNDKTIKHYLRRHDGELIIEVLREVLHPNVTSTPRDRMWSELDVAVRKIKRGKPTADDRGFARGIALCLAIMESPNGEPDIDLIREESMERLRAP